MGPDEEIYEQLELVKERILEFRDDLLEGRLKKQDLTDFVNFFNTDEVADMVEKSKILEDIKETTQYMTSEKDKNVRAQLKAQLTDYLENFDVD